MNILVLGNGFDLEHGLPTMYTDFLDFLKEFSEEYFYRSVYHTTFGLDVVKSNYIKKLFEKVEYSERLNALTLFTINNLWIEHFENVRKQNMKKQGNWIDFEKEISRIIQAYNDLINYHENQKTGISVSEKAIERSKDIVKEVLYKNKLTEETRKINITKLLEDLNRLIGALEIYIWDYIGSRKLDYYNPSVNDIHVDKVLSFNYSDTFRILYDNDSEVEYCFVHGKAENNISFFRSEECQDEKLKKKCIKTNAENNNMVLGIDEYLPEDKRSKETDFIAFKKYYQRIYKKTGNEYKNWLQQIDENKLSGDSTENTVYIFGHSLDETDGDILRELIDFPDMKTVIFYRDKDQLGQQIANLVKILKSDNVIEKVYGSNPSIEFRQQMERKNIEGSVFEITFDIRKLKKVYKYSNLQVEQIIKKIKRKIDKEDKKYFHSQHMVISLFDEIQKMGLARIYEDGLLKIAYSLIKNDGLERPVQYSTEDWEYQNYDNSIGCDRATEEFINFINSYNKKNFVRDKNLVLSFKRKIVDSVKNLISERNLNKGKYLEIIQDIFKQFDDQNADTEELWKLLIYVSNEYDKVYDGNYAIYALENKLENINDIVQIIRYHQLVDKLKMNDFFDSQAAQTDFD